MRRLLILLGVCALSATAALAADCKANDCACCGDVCQQTCCCCK